MHDTGRVRMFGLPIDALTLEETAQKARRMAKSGKPHQHVVVNAAKVVAAQEDERLARVIDSCDLVSADGMSIVWAGRLLGAKLPERVPGIDLMVRLLELASEDGSSVYLLGAKRTVVEALAAQLRRSHPGLNIVGARDGYWENDDEIVAAVRHAHPQYLFLGIPSPRKEFWLRRWLPELEAGLVMGVGGSFDVLAGLRHRAPRWAQGHGLEWLWRLLQEPRRMWRRYLVGNARFSWLVAYEWGRQRFGNSTRARGI